MRVWGRRDALRAAGLGAVAAALSACTSSAARLRRSSSSPPSPSSSLSSSPSSSSTARSTVPSSSPTEPSSSRTRVVGPRPGFPQLERVLDGRLARPGTRRYRPQRLLYNPRFGNQPPPQAIAYCRTPADVAACVRFAAEGGAALRVRNGGHSYGGWSSGTGLVADLSGLRSIRIDRHARTATIGGGALLAEVYSAVGARGGAIGAGSCPSVGVSGLTLGGGIGLLTRAYGLTCDQVVGFEVVTADGRVREVDDRHEPDLFWALRGGGGSFAAVTSLTFRVRPAPTMQRFLLTWPLSDGPEIVAAWQDWIDASPPELMSTCKLLSSAGQQEVLVLSWWIGRGSAATHRDALLRATPTPASDSSETDDYLATMRIAAGCATDESAAACLRAAWAPADREASSAASAIVRRAVPERGLRALVDVLGEAPDVPGIDGGAASFDALGGAVGDVDPGASAFPWRSGLADIQYSATWPYATATQDPGRYDRYVRRLRATLRPWVGDSAYVNYADPSLPDYATAYWGENLPRLQQIKRQYDPGDVFSFPQSVPLP